MHQARRAGFFALAFATQLGLIRPSFTAPPEPGTPATNLFTRNSKWAGTLTLPDGARPIEGKLTDVQDQEFTLRLPSARHGTRDWKLTLRGNDLTLASCLPTAASNDTQLRNLAITGSVNLDANGVAETLTLQGTWLYQTKRAGGTERVSLTLKRAGK